MPKKTKPRRWPCCRCAEERADAIGAICRRCAEAVTCEQCHIPSLAPPEIRVCLSCRARNARQLRALHAAAVTVAELELDGLAGRTIYPMRAPLTAIAAARLAHAAAPLAACAREVLPAEELRAARFGPLSFGQLELELELPTKARARRR